MRASQCVKVWIDNAIINRLVVARRSFWIGPDQLDQARDPGLLANSTGVVASVIICRAAL